MPLSNTVRISRHITYVGKGDFNTKGKSTSGKLSTAAVLIKINCAVKRAYFIFPQSVDFLFTHVLLCLLCRSYPRSATSTSFKMPKVKSKPSKKPIDLVNEYGSDILSTDNTVKLVASQSIMKKSILSMSVCKRLNTNQRQRK
ncbi:hypothetical protein T08_7666 [Trichinella sp. T8]|nr:hypothetical protein T08_7666 [Trichinella sp. T8]